MLHQRYTQCMDTLRTQAILASGFRNFKCRPFMGLFDDSESYLISHSPNLWKNSWHAPFLNVTYLCVERHMMYLKYIEVSNNKNSCYSCFKSFVRFFGKVKGLPRSRRIKFNVTCEWFFPAARTDKPLKST